MHTIQGLGIFLNLFTDFAFKWVFGTLQNKALLIDFINAILMGEQRIIDLEYRTCERLGFVEEERKVIFDLLCENDRGEKILIELQQARQTWFKDRVLYYTANLIQEQGVRGKWDYKLKPTYVISLLNFSLEKDGTSLVHRISLWNTTQQKQWSDRIQMVFLEAPKFNKNLEQCETRLDQWLYFLCNLHKLDRMPQTICDPIFLQLAEASTIGRFPEVERIRYLANLSEEERMEEALLYARMAAEEEGRALGLEQGLSQGLSQGISQGIEQGLALDKIQVVESMLARGWDWGIIQDITQLDQSGFEALKLKWKPQ